MGKMGQCMLEVKYLENPNLTVVGLLSLVVLNH
jgi:hypothetical protein